jgi:hypothetical protein
MSAARRAIHGRTGRGGLDGVASLLLSCGAAFLIFDGFVCLVAFRFMRALDPEALLVFGLLGAVVAPLYWCGRSIGQKIRYQLALSR